MSEIKSSEDIRQLANAFRESRTLLSAIELKIFTVLDTHLMTSEVVSKEINTDHRATDRLMNALCGMGILKKVKAKFYNSDLSSKYLIEGKPDFMGGLFHTNHLWNSWSHLTESVKKGNSVIGNQNKSEKDEWVDAFIGAMHYRGVKQGKILAMMIDLLQTKKILDVGGGSAAFSMEMVKRNPSIEAVVLDLPHVIPLTKKYVEQAGLLDNFSFIEGDYHKKDFDNGYDLILLSAIVHINSYEQNKILVKKCADALNSNGMLIISDFIMNENRTEPYHGALFALNMLVGTANGDTYTESEIRAWFESAGLNNIERKNTSFGSDLMIGIK
ncbi:MAG TPA: methyltransferase [Ignavibacteriaceae bacterium]|nr:methyltransferase [Ignavibacteriaceae bacterium]